MNALTFYPGLAFVHIPSAAGKGITVLQAQHFGTVYRTFRLAGYVATRWLLTPWLGPRDLLLVKCDLAALGAVLGSVLLGSWCRPAGPSPRADSPANSGPSRPRRWRPSQQSPLACSPCRRRRPRHHGPGRPGRLPSPSRHSRARSPRASLPHLAHGFKCSRIDAHRSAPPGAVMREVRRRCITATTRRITWYGRQSTPSRPTSGEILGVAVRSIIASDLGYYGPAAGPRSQAATHEGGRR
jgi:hypothetical protein